MAALLVAHKWLPAGRRRFLEILPGIWRTLILWLVAGAGFGRYLAEFSFTYVNTYAGLASAMIALVFLYWTASIFVYGGELNAAYLRSRSRATAQTDRRHVSGSIAGAIDLFSRRLDRIVQRAQALLLEH